MAWQVTESSGKKYYRYHQENTLENGDTISVYVNGVKVAESELTATAQTKVYIDGVGREL